MASVRIEEWQFLHQGMTGVASAPMFPVLAFQQVALGAGSTQSAAFSAATRYIRVQAEGIACIDIGPNPTADAAKLRLTAGQTEFYGVSPGWKLACITTT
jgi:hypothetical protein